MTGMTVGSIDSHGNIQKELLLYTRRFYAVDTIHAIGLILLGRSLSRNVTAERRYSLGGAIYVGT